MEKIVYSCSWKDGLSWQEVLQKSIYSDLIETSLLNLKSFVGKDFLGIKRKFELIYAL